MNTGSSRLNRFVALVMLLICLLISTESFSQTVIHPTKKNIPVSTDPKFALRHQVADHTLWDWNSLDMVSIGVDEGDYSQMIGVIADVEIDHRGTIYYADIVHSQVRSYDYLGKWIANIGAAGHGPGEFRQPMGVGVFADRAQIMIADFQMNQIFKREDDTFQFISSHRPKHYSSTGQLCVLDDHYYLLHAGNFSDSQGNSDIIHKYSLAGDWIDSFGDSYDYDDPFIVSMMMINSFLSCNSEHKTIAIVINHIPAMTAYSEQGDRLWQVTFPEYRPDIVEEDIKNGRKYHSVMSKDGRSIFQSLFSDKKNFYVTYGRQNSSPNRSPPFWFSDNHVFRVDAKTGLGEYLGAGAPGANSGEHIVAIDGDYRFTITTTGTPQIRIYKPK